MASSNLFPSILVEFGVDEKKNNEKLSVTCSFCALQMIDFVNKFLQINGLNMDEQYVSIGETS